MELRDFEMLSDMAERAQTKRLGLRLPPRLVLAGSALSDGAYLTLLLLLLKLINIRK